MKEINPDLIRILQAYPAYIRGLGLISSKRRPKKQRNLSNNPDLIRIFQAYPADIRGLGIISPQIGYFRLILPNLGSLGYLRKIKPVLIRIFQAYPAYIKDIRVGSNIPTQIGYFRLSLPIGI